MNFPVDLTELWSYPKSNCVFITEKNADFFLNIADTFRQLNRNVWQLSNNIAAIVTYMIEIPVQCYTGTSKLWFLINLQYNINILRNQNYVSTVNLFFSV